MICHIKYSSNKFHIWSHKKKKVHHTSDNPEIHDRWPFQLEYLIAFGNSKRQIQVVLIITFRIILLLNQFLIIASFDNYQDKMNAKGQNRSRLLEEHNGYENKQPHFLISYIVSLFNKELTGCDCFC